MLRSNSRIESSKMLGVTKSKYVGKVVAGVCGYSLIIYVILVSVQPYTVFASYALKDAFIAQGAAIPNKDLGKYWVIVQKPMTWGDASAECDLEFYRLAMIDTIDKAKELVDAIKSISEAYTAAYDKKFKEVEFGMDRRYWIGLTDQLEEGKYVWTHNGSEVLYDFWYPNQPDHGNPKPGDTRKDREKEHCVSLWNPGYHCNDLHSYNDEPCRNLYYPICDKSKPSPPSNAGPPPAAPAPAPSG